MTMKSLLLVVGIISVFSIISVPVIGADSLTIEAVRAKSVLDDADFKAIDNFVAGAVGDMLETEDFSSISNTRAIIVANSASTQPNQTQFADQFSKSAQKYISAALTKAETLTLPARSFKVMTNLLMLTDALADAHLADIALKYADDKNQVIRYWAVHSVTNPDITEKLNDPKETDAARRVIKRLDEVVAVSSPDVLGLIASFAGSIKMPEGEALLLKVADQRITSYANWTVERELTDAKILQILCDKMTSSIATKDAIGKRFGQLLSYASQRYIKGADYLGADQKEQLISVLVETEQSCLSKITGKPRFDIKRAIEAGDISALQKVYNGLFGDGTTAGELSFNYGNADDGSPMKTPLLLSAPPK